MDGVRFAVSLRRLRRSPTFWHGRCRSERCFSRRFCSNRLINGHLNAQKPPCTASLERSFDPGAAWPPSFESSFDPGATWRVSLERSFDPGVAWRVSFDRSFNPGAAVQGPFERSFDPCASEENADVIPGHRGSYRGGIPHRATRIRHRPSPLAVPPFPPIALLPACAHPSSVSALQSSHQESCCRCGRLR